MLFTSGARACSRTGPRTATAYAKAKGRRHDHRQRDRHRGTDGRRGSHNTCARLERGGPTGHSGLGRL